MLDDCTVRPIPPEQFCAKYSAVMYVYRKFQYLSKYVVIKF